MSESSGKSAPFLSAAGALFCLAGVGAAFIMDARAGAAAIAASLGAFGVGLARGRGAAPIASTSSTEAARAPAKRTPRRDDARPKGLLHPEDRERLTRWIAEPLEILKTADQGGTLTGFNQARACPGMGQMAAWRRSRGEEHPEAEAVCRAAEEAVQAALIEAAEYFSPLLESMDRRGEQPHELIARSRERIVAVRRQTITLLDELRTRLQNLPVTTQESFEF